MQSKNKKPMTALEKVHVLKIKEMPCVICNHPAPSEAHEIEQGEWFTSIPLCPDCHRGSKNGLHGQRAMWNVLKATELGALGSTIARLLYERS